MSAHEWFSLIVALIKALAWPIAVGVIVWRLGPKFLDAIRGRSVNVEGFGVRASFTTVEQQITSVDSPVNRPALEPPTPGPGPVVREAVTLLEQGIIKELGKYPPTAREPTLINALATTRVKGAHEFNYNRIFGSQIAALRLLDERGSATIEEARTFFGAYAKQYPHIYAKYGFDGWLGFMLNAQLMKRTADTLTTTPFGHDFLVYLREVRLSETKPA